jgi:hypothetical protein
MLHFQAAASRRSEAITAHPPVFQRERNLSRCSICGAAFRRRNRMPCTRKIDDRYEVTISSDRCRTGGWESEGHIFVTATGKSNGVTVKGEGRTLPSAEQRAFAEARKWCFDRRMSRDEDQ